MGRRVLIVCPEPLRRVRTGVAIRLTEIARCLQATHRVTLAAPEVEPELALPFETVRHSPPSFASLLEGRDVVIVHGHVGNDVLAAEPRVPVVFDLYDPFLIENLAYAATLGPEVNRYDRLTLDRQLRHGDFFLCASEEQRAFYLGMLAILGRVNPGTYGKGRDLRHLLAVAPFGAPSEAPPVRHGRLKEKLGVGDAPLVFFGGIYDWYDPLVAIEALELLAREGGRVGETRLLLLRNPNAATTPQTLFQATLDRAKALSVEKNVLQMDWIPYEERASAFAGADVALVTHRPGIETDLSFRTRVLDFLWAGLPVIATRGGAASALLERVGAGRVVPCGDAGAVASALREVICDRALADRLGEAGKTYAREHLAWPKMLAPLVNWLEEPAVDPHKPKTDEAPRRGRFARLLGRR